jgi:hypothetical protein
MKFWEAVEHARNTGEKIRMSSEYSGLACWRRGELVWDHGGPVGIGESNIDAHWQAVAPPPPKEYSFEYSFMEAFQMMWQGKWMRPRNSTGWSKKIDGESVVLGQLGGSQHVCDLQKGFLVWEIRSKWIEA